jgi:sugar lactone lactonase YvrE
MKLEPILTGLSFPEAPRWRDGRLYFSDLYTKRVMATDPDGRAETIVEVPNQPSGLGWRTGGTMLIVSMLDRKLMGFTTGKLSVLADLSKLATGHCNDMVVDSDGRAYVGNFGYDRHRGEMPRTTCIVRVDTDNKVTKVADNLAFPNGSIITPDGRTMIVAETGAQRLTAFEIESNGMLGKRRLFAEIRGCMPDGICLDAEGGVWVAGAGSRRLLRVLEGGKITHDLELSPRAAYACMLGGIDRKTLFVLTNTNSGPSMAAKRDGRIEVMRVDVPGVGWP